MGPAGIDSVCQVAGAEKSVESAECVVTQISASTLPQVPVGNVAVKVTTMSLPSVAEVTTALKAYALLATSADKGAVRNKAMLDGL